MTRVQRLGAAALSLLLVAACGGGEPAVIDAGKVAEAGAITDFHNADGAIAYRDAQLPPAADAGRDAGRDATAPATDAAVPREPEGDAGHRACRNGLHDGSETDIDCGGPDCGTCLSGRKCGAREDCLSGECVAGLCSCIPVDSCPSGACGALHNCGMTLDCGGCAAGVCYRNQCCEPRVCKPGECGVYSDGCGGTLRCVDPSCCEPRDCGHPSLLGRCGDYDDRCGGTVSCSCASAADRCYIGECCTPLDCSAWVGPGCATISDGCGGTRSCSCAGELGCVSGKCCDAKTCSEQGKDHRCGPTTDTCGGALWCGCEQGNGMRVQQRSACGSSCADTLGEVSTCTAAAPTETLVQTAGWDFGGNLWSSDLCNASYGFSPNWTQCHSGYQLDAQGFVHLSAGMHCFAVTGSGGNGCGSLYLVTANQDGFAGWDALAPATTALAATGSGTACVTVAQVDYYPIRWHYTQSGTNVSFRVRYCAGSCTPSSALPASMLYPALP